MWTNTLRRSTKPPWSSVSPPPPSSFTQTHRRSRPESPWENMSGMPYRLAPKPPTRNKHSPIPLPTTPPHHQLSWDAEEIKIAHDQQMINYRLPDHLLNLTVMSRQRPVLEGATATMNMSSQPKTHPRARPISHTSRDTSENWKWCMRYQRERLTPSSNQ